MLDTALHTHHLMCVLSYRAYRRFQPEKYVKRSCLCVFFLRCEHSILYSYMYFNPHVYRTEKKNLFFRWKPERHCSFVIVMCNLSVEHAVRSLFCDGRCCDSTRSYTHCLEIHNGPNWSERTTNGVRWHTAYSHHYAWLRQIRNENSCPIPSHAVIIIIIFFSLPICS